MFRFATFILLDAARMGGQIAEAQARNKAYDSLYRGAGEAPLPEVAPYIFQFAHPTPFSGWYLGRGWGDSWGILVKSAWPLSELHKHFRRFLRIKTESGRILYFRFYDPRVLRIYLPTCSPEQIREFFGDAIDYFLVEDEDPAFGIRYWHQNGVLQSERFAVNEAMDANAVPPLPEPPQEKLPAETIEYLRAEGVLLEVLQARGETIADYEGLELTTPEPVEAHTHTHEHTHDHTHDSTPPPPSITPKEDPPSPGTKPKSKWNMFD